MSVNKFDQAPEIATTKMTTRNTEITKDIFAILSYDEEENTPNEFGVNDPIIGIIYRRKKQHQ